MAGILIQKPRSVIPRWRLFAKTVALGELDGVGSRRLTSFGLGGLENAVREWKEEQSIWHATDLISSAFVLGHPEVANDAATFVLENRKQASSAAIALASRLLFGDMQEEPDTQRDWNTVIRDSRATLREYPRDAARWADLGLAHTICGHEKAALDCLKIAVQLAPSNRFVLRTASRCFIHWNDPELAHSILRTADNAKHDPWLMSAEIAIASAHGKRSLLTKQAKQLLTDTSIHPHALSELATAIASLELENGSPRAALRLFRQAIVDPTENSVAQITYVYTEKNLGPVSGLFEAEIPLLFEARARDRYFAGDWNGAIDYAEQWYSDQPFSSRPSYMASYASSLLGDYERAIRFLDRLLKLNRNDPMALNNLAFFEILRGNLENGMRAFDEAKRLGTDEEGELVLEATAGLIEFRKGNDGLGRTLYRRTIHKASAKKNRRIRALAVLNLAREEFLVENQPEAGKLLQEARNIARRVNDKVFEAELALVEDVILRNAPVGALS